MTWVEVDGTRYPIDDDGEVEWRLRYAHGTLTLEEGREAATIMAAYRHFTDPLVDDADAVASLGRARAGVKDFLAHKEQEMADAVAVEWLVIADMQWGDGREVRGPYTIVDANRVADSYAPDKWTTEVKRVVK